MDTDSTPSSSNHLDNEARHSAKQWIELSERMTICSRRLRGLVGHGCDRVQLSDAELSLLWACLEASPGGRSQRDLAHLLAVSPAHVSEHLEQLRRQGLLTGRRNLGDRRRQNWEPTPAGRTRFQLLLEHLATWVLQLDPSFDPMDLLLQLARLAGALSDSPAGRQAGPNAAESLETALARLRGAA